MLNKIFTDSILASVYQFDYFTEIQTVPNTNIRHAEYFTINNSSFLAYSVSNNRLSHCTNSIITRWNAVSGNFTEYQQIPTSGAVKMVFFRTAWDDSYLFIVNSKSGCASIEGKFIWSFRFQTVVLSRHSAR